MLPFAPRASSHHKDLPVSQDQTGRAALPLEGECKWDSYKQPDLSGQYDIHSPPPKPTTPGGQIQSLVSSFNQRLRPTCDLDRHERHVIYFLPGMFKRHAKWCERFWSQIKINKTAGQACGLTIKNLIWQHVHLLIKYIFCQSVLTENDGSAFTFTPTVALLSAFHRSCLIKLYPNWNWTEFDWYTLWNYMKHFTECLCILFKSFKVSKIKKKKVMYNLSKDVLNWPKVTVKTI